jgi:hypothetical protein
VHIAAFSSTLASVPSNGLSHPGILLDGGDSGSAIPGGQDTVVPRIRTRSAGRPRLLGEREEEPRCDRMCQSGSNAPQQTAKPRLSNRERSGSAERDPRRTWLRVTVPPPPSPHGWVRSDAAKRFRDADPSCPSFPAGFRYRMNHVAGGLFGLRVGDRQVFPGPSANLGEIEGFQTRLP